MIREMQPWPVVSRKLTRQIRRLKGDFEQLEAKRDYIDKIESSSVYQKLILNHN